MALCYTLQGHQGPLGRIGFNGEDGSPVRTAFILNIFTFLRYIICININKSKTNKFSLVIGIFISSEFSYVRSGFGKG